MVMQAATRRALPQKRGPPNFENTTWKIHGNFMWKMEKAARKQGLQNAHASKSWLCVWWGIKLCEVEKHRNGVDHTGKRQKQWMPTHDANLYSFVWVSMWECFDLHQPNAKRWSPNSNPIYDGKKERPPPCMILKKLFVKAAPASSPNSSLSSPMFLLFYSSFSPFFSSSSWSYSSSPSVLCHRLSFFWPSMVLRWFVFPPRLPPPS